ncbi:LOW QUALITY PROTEIN: hypothetical protein V2J09_012603 [Rumex salicifolius]
MHYGTCKISGHKIGSSLTPPIKLEYTFFFHSNRSADHLLEDISYERLRRKAESNLAAKLRLGSVLLMSDPSASNRHVHQIRANVDTSVIVGRQVDEDLIVDELCRPNIDHVLRVIAIFGMSDDFFIDMWVAQGFIQPSKTGDNGIRALGLDYINSMLAIGLLQHSNNVRRPLCMHDLALYISKDTCLFIRDNDRVDNPSSGLEYLQFPETVTQCTLHTLNCYSVAAISLDLVVAHSRFLRQLALKNCGLKEIPRSIGILKHLRILRLDMNPFEYLPESIGKLYNLQILSLPHCDRLVELPQTITKLLNLRIIHVTKVVPIPKGMGQMTCLEILSVVKLEDGSEIKELGSLQRLRKSIELEQLENISSSLNTKAGIGRLVLNWTSSEEDEIENKAITSVENFRDKRFSTWLSNGLYYNNLTSLVLEDCKRCEQLPTLGGLPCLEYKSLGFDKTLT